MNREVEHGRIRLLQEDALDKEGRPTKRVARHEDGGEAGIFEGEKRGKRGGEEGRPDLHG